MEEFLVYSKQKKQLKAIQNYVSKLFSKDSTGHDFHHMKRVAKLAKLIAENEGADIFLSEAGGWLHDVGDHKLFDDPEREKEKMIQFLEEIKLDSRRIDQLITAIEDISFRDQKIPKTIEGKIIQDADRLDAIGAIGIARTFAYGGARGQAIYDHDSPENTSIQHFYDKLLLLKDGLNTNSAKNIAETRHAYMEDFLKQFLKEWTL